MGFIEETGAAQYLMLAGNRVAGWQMARALIVAEDRLAAGPRAHRAGFVPRVTERAGVFVAH